jgi:hypothetical protein
MPLTANLTFKNKLIQNELLKYTQIFAIIEHPASNKKYKIFLKDNGLGVDKVKGDGIFSHQYRLHYLPGLYNVTYYAIGLSFKRLSAQQIFVHEFPGKVIAKYNLQTRFIEMGARISSPFVDVDTANLTAFFYEPGGSFHTFSMDKTDANTWYIEAPSYNKWKFDKVIISFTGKSKQGKDIEIKFAPIDVQKIYKAALNEQNVKNRSQIMAADTLQLGHILDYSREKLAQEYALVSYLTHYKEDFPRPRKFYQTMDQKILSWWKQGKNSKPTFSVGITNLPDSDVINDLELLEETDVKNNNIKHDNAKNQIEEDIKDAANPSISSVEEQVIEQQGSGIGTTILIFVICIFMLATFAGMGVAVWMLTGKKPLPIPSFVRKKLGLSANEETTASDESSSKETGDSTESKGSKPKKPSKPARSKPTESKSKNESLDKDEIEINLDDEDIEEEPEEEQPHEVADNLKSPPKPPPPPPQKGAGISIEKEKPQSFGPIPGFTGEAPVASKVEPFKQENKTPDGKVEPVVKDTAENENVKVTSQISEEERQSIVSGLKDSVLDNEPKERVVATSSIFHYEDDDREDLSTKEEDESEQKLAEQITMPEESQARDATDNPEQEKDDNTGERKRPPQGPQDPPTADEQSK